MEEGGRFVLPKIIRVLSEIMSTACCESCDVADVAACVSLCREIDNLMNGFCILTYVMEFFIHGTMGQP